MQCLHDIVLLISNQPWNIDFYITLFINFQLTM